MKASDAIAKILSANNVTVGFELIGGMITHLVDSINVLGETKLISVHHEQAAAFAAGGVARATSNKSLGLALGTSGPGATNLVTGIADCWFDNYPCIFITGQVNTNELKGTRNIRQQGFQELDIVSIVKSITKYAVQIQTPEDIVVEIQKAIDISVSGRPGPVLIDIPMDLQRVELNDIDLDYLIGLNNVKPTLPELNKSTQSQLQEAVDCFLNAKQPIFLIGGGAVSEPSFATWQQNISEHKIPHVTSLKGSEKTPVLDGYWGMIGAYGTRTGNYAIQNADVIIVLGSRLDVRQTGADVNDFARLAKTVIQIDLDPAQLDNRFKADVNIHATCEQFYKVYLQSINKLSLISKDWINTLEQHWQNSFINEYPELKMSPFNICEILSKRFNNIATHFVADVGNNQMWIAHSLRIGRSQMIHHSGGLGAMGFAIPTSLGVHYATDNIVVSISGDGGAQLNIQELDIISREKLPILTIIVNNQSLGMVRAFQEMYFDGRNQSTFWDGYSSSFCEIGKAYQMKSSQITSEDEFDSAILEFIQNPQPTLLELVMPDARECKPRLAFGNPIDKQHPNGNT
tara:strand:- start:16908 stop:18629 length:1722 start_codon:yes stop_codon:yes gene_type:complete